MIAADKAQLTADIVQQGLEVRLRELELFVSNLHRLHGASALLAGFCFMFILFNIGHWDMDMMTGMSGGMMSMGSSSGGMGGGGMGGGGMGGGGMGGGGMGGGRMANRTHSVNGVDPNNSLFFFIWLCLLGLCANLAVVAHSTTYAVLGPEPAFYGSVQDVHLVVTALRGRVVVLARLFLLGIGCIWMACAVLPGHTTSMAMAMACGRSRQGRCLTVVCLFLLGACVLVALHDWLLGPPQTWWQLCAWYVEISDMMQRVGEYGADIGEISG